MNVRNKAITQYHGFTDCNSMCVLKREALMFCDDTIDTFGYDNSDDSGENIAAFVKFLGTDMGVPNAKSLRSSHVSYYSDGKIKITWTADEIAERSETLPVAKDSKGFHDYKVIGNREVEGTYMEFRIDNVNGSDFTLNALRVVPIIKNLGKNK